MRVRLLGLCLPLVFACSGTNVVAGPEQTQAERIEASLPEWCNDLCSTTRMCEASGCVCEGDVCNCGVEDKCESNCQSVLTTLIHVSASCAASAERLQKCYEAQGCGVFGNDQPCQVFEQEAQLCDPDDFGGPSVEGEGSGPSAGSGEVPSLDGSSSGSAGAANMAPSMGPSVGPTYRPEVICQGGFGGGQGAPEPGTTKVICEQGRFDCSDGSDYSMICIAASTGQRACSCLVDEVVTRAFSPGEGCPTQAQMNAGCGWRLAEL